jgi:hypothetical protein
MEMYLERYSLLKFIALAWSFGDEPSPEVMRTLREKYGVNTLLDLDKVIHELHKKLIESREIDSIIPTGKVDTDLLTIAGLLRALGHQIYEIRGSPWKKGMVMTEYGTFIIKISNEGATILFDLDNPISLREFVEKYVYPGDEHAKDELSNYLSIRDLGDKYSISYDGFSEEEIELISAYTEGEKRVDGKRIEIVIPKDEELVSKTLHTIGVYHYREILLMDEDYYNYMSENMDYISNLHEALHEIRLRYGWVKSFKVGDYDLHVHEDRVDFHVKGKVVITGTGREVFSRVVAVLSVLDSDFEHGKVRGDHIDAVMNELSSLVRPREKYDMKREVAVSN